MGVCDLYVYACKDLHEYRFFMHLYSVDANPQYCMVPTKNFLQKDYNILPKYYLLLSAIDA